MEDKDGKKRGESCVPLSSPPQLRSRETMTALGRGGPQHHPTIPNTLPHNESLTKIERKHYNSSSIIIQKIESSPTMSSSFFSEVTLFKRILYTTCILYVLCTAIAVVIEPYLTLSCDSLTTSTTTTSITKLTFPNPFYIHNPCQSKVRYLQLMGLTRRECEFGRNMVMSVLLGSIIGYERRTADRPAGIRTMSVVSLTSCLFTLNSTFVFMIGPMR